MCSQSQGCAETRSLPQVLAVGSGLQDRSSLHWWQPVIERAGTGAEAQAMERDWAPLALALELCDGEPKAWEADSASKLRKQDAADRCVGGGPSVRAHIAVLHHLLHVPRQVSALGPGSRAE